MKIFLIIAQCCLVAGCGLMTPAMYDESTHSFTSGDIRLTGSLYTPRSTTLPPLIVIAHGAGDAKRSFTLYKHFAEYFSGRGIAVFVFDKRGVGDSEGRYVEGEIHFDSLGIDLAAAFTFASHLPGHSPERSGILGISQAGWTIPLALQHIDTIAFIVNISGPSVPPYYSDMYYRANEWREAGYSEEELREIVEYNRIIARYVGTFDDRPAAIAAKQKYKERRWFNELHYTPTLQPEDTLRLPRYDHYRRSAFDPAPYWNRPDIPVLCLFGDKDAHIPVDTIARRFEMIFSAKHFKDFSIKRFPDGGHILQQVDGLRENVGHDPISMILNGFPEPTAESMLFLEVWLNRKTNL